MAPEQLGGQPIDARSDLYALGLVIAEMVPDLGTAPEWLRELVVRLREPDPADRPSSAADVARALETGRLDLDAEASRLSPDARESGAGQGVAAVDPDAVTRSFSVPDAAVAEPPRPQPDVAAAAAIAAPAAVAAPAAPGANPKPAPEQTRPRRASRVDNRPIVAGVLLTGLLLAGFALARGNLFGTASATPTPFGAPAVIATPAPTDLPAAPPAPKPHKGHGHGRG